ncbi:MAG TPA: sulfurtransferase TusA family protein [Ktedonobacterales bacterium]
MTPAMHVDRFVDAQGQMCPMPVLSLAKAFRELQPGQVLAISATDQGAKSDIPAWAEKTGNRLLDTTDEQGVLTFYLQKSS